MLLWANRWTGGIGVCQGIVLRAWMQVIEAYQRWVKYCMCYTSQGLQYSVNISFAPDKHCLPVCHSLLLCSPHRSKSVVAPPAATLIQRCQQNERGKVYESVCVCRRGVAHVCIWKREGSGSWHNMRGELSPHLIEIDCHMSEFRSHTASDCQLLFSHPSNGITVSKSRTETGSAFACSPLGY